MKSAGAVDSRAAGNQEGGRGGDGRWPSIPAKRQIALYPAAGHHCDACFATIVTRYPLPCRLLPSTDLLLQIQCLEALGGTTSIVDSAFTMNILCSPISERKPTTSNNDPLFTSLFYSFHLHSPPCYCYFYFFPPPVIDPTIFEQSQNRETRTRTPSVDAFVTPEENTHRFR